MKINMNRSNGMIQKECIESAINNQRENDMVCTPDYGTQPCDIPINSYTYDMDDEFIYILTTVTIPNGFVLLGEDYDTYLNLDTSYLNTLRVTQNCQCGNNPFCISKRNCTLLNGELEYNVTLSQFRAACPLENAALTPTTSFSTFGTIYIDKLIHCTLDPNCELLTDYKIVPEKCEEYISTIGGESIYRCKDASQYYCILRNPNYCRMINIPYRLQIQACDKA